MKQRKRVLTVAIAMMAMASLTPVKAQQQLRVPVGTDVITNRGDVNCDGYVDVADIATIIDIMSGNAIFNGTFSESGDEAYFNILGVPVKMIRVEAGSFTMGSTEQDNEKWPHTVTLTQDFYIAETEVTQKLWVSLMGELNNPVQSYYRGDEHPIINVSWNDCQSFIQNLNSITGQEFRLPTEAEWEFAAHGGNKSQGYKYAGSDDIEEVAWYEANSYSLSTIDPNFGIHDVKTKKPNELGLYDMSGNAKEWCSDWFQSGYGAVARTDPKGPETGNGRVLKGGSWMTRASFCRITSRDVSNPDKIHAGNGFRLVMSVPAKQEGK